MRDLSFLGFSAGAVVLMLRSLLGDDRVNSRKDTKRPAGRMRKVWALSASAGCAPLRAALRADLCAVPPLISLQSPRHLLARFVESRDEG